MGGDAGDIEFWLSRIKASGKLVIVEGKKDRKALSDLGVENIMTISKPLYKVAEDAAESSRDVIILTDFDRKGKELYGKLKKDIIKQGARVDSFFREYLMKNTRLSHIEGIFRYIHNNPPNNAS